MVAASDGVNSDVKNFVWTITQAGTLTINPMASPAPQLAGESVTFTASVTGGSNVRYQWNFDDGTPVTALSAEPTVTHSFTKPGIYYVSVTAIDDSGLPQTKTVVQTVHLPLSANRPAVSSNIALEDRAAASDRLWVVNQDNDSVSVFDTVTRAKLAEITVGSAPRTLAIAPNGEVWVTNKQSATVSVINPSTLAVARTLSLPFASQPFGIAMSPTGGFAYVALEAAGKLLKMDVAAYTVAGSVDVGANPRHVSVNGNGSLVYVSRFVTPFQPGESTAVVQTSSGGTPTGGQVVVVDAAAMAPQQTIVLRHSDKPDAENQGRGVPNYLGAATLSPDGQSAWVPSKQDNVQRGTLRDGRGLDFQNTVRAIGSRIDLAGGTENYAARLDFDNAGVASAALFDRLGVYLFVALETSREVAIVSAHDDWQIFRIDVGRAPQGLALSADGRTLYVNNFMDRTVSVFDLTSLVVDGNVDVPLRATLVSVGTEKLSATVLKGKQLFYDAKDLRLARDGYVSCASCHNDGGQDGRVWDLTGFGEGLRNTSNLRGRAATGQGFLHWSNNFDEVQDFEGQIRTLAGGTGLMTNDQFNTGTPQPAARRSQDRREQRPGCARGLRGVAQYLPVEPVAQRQRHPDQCGRRGQGGVRREELRQLSWRQGVHEQRQQQSAGRRHAHDGQRQPPGWPADRHRHSDAARRVGDGALPAQWLGRHDRDCDPGTRRIHRDRHRVEQPGRLRRADREPGDDGAHQQLAEHGCRARRPVLQQHDALGLTRPAAHGSGELRLEHQLAGAGRQRGPVLGPLERQGGGDLDRQLPVPDRVQ